MSHDYSKLRGMIYEKFGTAKKFADTVGINPSNLSGKLSGKIPFTQNDIDKIIKALNLESSEVGDFFYKLKTQSIE